MLCHVNLYTTIYLIISSYLPHIIWKKRRLLWNYESGMILVRKSMKNSWKHLHPFQIVYFWPDSVQQLCNFSPEENSWNQLNNNFFFNPWWTDIIWSILYSKWDVYFQNRTCYIYEFLICHIMVCIIFYVLSKYSEPVVTEAPCDHLLWSE